MKKALLVLLLAALVLPVFADDALVMPKGVFRIWVAPNYGFADKAFDDGGDKVNIVSPVTSTVSDGIKFFNLALALEYGVTDWITAAIQWAPGWNIWSTMGWDDAGPLYWSQAVLGDFADLFLGAKFQIVGPKAPVQRTDMRLAAATGVKIPMPSASSADIVPTTDSEFVISEPDNHLWGLGFRFYYDYIVNSSFFVNLYSEFIFYPEQKVNDSVKFGDDTKVAYGYDLTLEVEPQYQMPLANGMILKAGLPISYDMSPETEIDGVGDNDESNLFYISPSVGVFFTKAVVPFELELQYRLPLMGKNAPVMHNIALQGKFYLKF